MTTGAKRFIIMPKKIGAGKEPQDYDKISGKYEKGDTSSDSDNEGSDKVDLFKEAEKAVTLSKQEWARYYLIIGTLKRGEFTSSAIVVDKSNRFVLIETENRCVLAIDNNRFEKCRVKATFSFDNYDRMYEFVKEYIDD